MLGEPGHGDISENSAVRVAVLGSNVSSLCSKEEDAVRAAEVESSDDHQGAIDQSTARPSLFSGFKGFNGFQLSTISSSRKTPQ